MPATVKMPSHELLDLKPEKLVITGFRSCAAGYDFSDASCWEAAWQAFQGELGPRCARCLMGELQFWVRSIRLNTERPLRYFPLGCRHLCHDECMALSALSAAQSGDEEAGRLAIRHLMEGADAAAIEDVWLAAQSFAEALKQSGQVLYPVTCSVIQSIAAMQARSAMPRGALN
jgi:hypothetical protein